MRNFLLLLVFVIFATLNVSAQYCTTGLYTNLGCTDNDVISSFSTTGGVANITNNNTGCSNTNVTDAYTYFSGMTHSALQGATVNFSVTLSDDWTEGVKIWVDYNNDGDFDDVGELVYNPAATVPAASAAQTGSFIIPPATTPGVKRMRVRCVFSTATFGPCTTHGYGEIEDYNLNVLPLGPCTSPPTAGTVTSSANPACSGSSFTLGISGGSFGTGQTYQWQSSPDNISWTDIASATNTTLTTTQTAPTYYRYRVTCGSPVTSASLLVGTAICYCPSIPTSTADEEIYSVTVNGATNSLPCNVAAPGPGSVLNKYSNFYPLGALTTLIPGTIIDFKVEQDECPSSGFFSNGCAIWIDFNQDGVFNDATERVYFENTTSLGPRTIIGNITIPSNATPGITGMRIIVAEGRSGAQLTSCMAYGFGETEDYLVNIIPPTPCSGAPTAGSATAFPTTVCLNQQVALKNTGAVLAVGQSYQWQVSTDNINWSDIAGAKNFVYSATQTLTSWYRFRIICDVTHDTSYTNSVQVYTPPILTGVYIIDKSVTGAANLYPNTRTFNSFFSAYDATKCGIGGAVIFNVAPGSGPYNEQLIMSGKIPNTSTTNTITFNGNNNIITFNTTAAEPAVIKLRNIEYIHFENLVINPTGATNGHGVHLTSDANYNMVSNCTVNLSTTVTTGFAGIVISGNETSPTGTGTTTALCDYNEIRNNTINGGVYGITLSATFTNGAHGYNIIAGNTIRNFYQNGIYVGGTYFTTIDSNYISRPNRTTSAATVQGILFTTQSINSSVKRNRITNPFGSQLNSTATFNAIDFNGCSGLSGSENVVSNNLVYKMNGVGAITGLSNTSSPNTWYAHNTVSLDSLSTASVNTRGFSQETAALGIIFYDNLISVTRTGPGTKYCIYTTGLLFACDYNNYYISASGGTSALGYYTANQTSLANWQTATSQDPHSLSKNPVFVNVNNGFDGYKPGNGAIDNKGLYFGIDTDIIGQLRGGSPSAPPGTNPDMGAFEFIAPACSVPPVNGTTNITPSGTVCQQTSIKLDLTIPPPGSYGSGQTFQWQYSTNATGPWTDLGTPLVSPDTTIIATSTLYYHAIVSCGAAIDSSNPVKITVTPAMPAGTYTIDQTNPSGTTYIASAPVAGTNFATFNAAKTAMQACGILGSVVFNVVPLTGPYNEQLKLDTIRGTSASSTVTFNGNGNTIAFKTTTPPTTNERAVIKLTRADFVTFDSLRIQATGAFTYGYGVQLLNNADNNIFRKCTILANSTSTSQNYGGIIINSTDAGLIVAGNTLSDDNLFEDNRINGGYYGITLVGDVTASGFINNNSFVRNRVEDFYSTGIYIAGTYNTLIESNIITRPARTSLLSPLYGIYLTAAPSPRIKISKNKIYHLLTGTPTNTATLYGIAHENVDVTAGNDNIVSNNLIYGLEGNGNIYALYNSSSDGVRYYHNTISLDHRFSSSTLVTRGFYQANTPAAVGIEFVNNIITITRTGTGTKHGIYLETTASEVTSDHNDIYINAPGANNFFGYSGGANRTTLAAWQAANPLKDQNSFSENPVYVDSANGNYSAGIQTINDVGVFVGIATDINGDIRNPLTPDIGAYEFVPISCIEPPLAGTASVTPASGICLEAPIVLNLTGNSGVGTLTFQWQSAPTAAGPWVNISPILYTPQFNTVTGTNTYYRAVVICGTGTPVYSTVTNVVLNNVVLAGTYTIDNSQPTNWPAVPVGSNFASFGAAVAAMNCGITGPVVFNVMPGTTSGVYTEQVRVPYIKNSSAVNTITFQSVSGVPSSAMLTFNGVSAANNYTLKLDGAKYITFQNMTIRATNVTIGRVVEIADTASYNTLNKCIITAPVTTGNNTNAIGVYANALKGTGNLIKGNTINNGSTGIYFWGTSAAALTADNIIDSNTISTSYIHGINANFHKHAKILRNTINVSAPRAATSYGIYASDCDSSYQVLKNTVNISSTTTQVYGIYITASDSSTTEYGKIIGNTVTAVTGNTGALYGIYVDNSSGHKVLNNVVAVKTNSATSCGLFTNSNYGTYHHNSVNSTSANGLAAGNNYAARFENGSLTGPNISIRNNIFSHKAGGRAMYIASTTQSRASDYNMLYTSGSVLVDKSGTPYANLQAWKTATFWDKYSIVYSPAFVSNNDLHPDLANPDVWAMHGRGIQVKGDTLDFNENYRPDSLTAGVPDLGAYEFFPTALPTVLNPIPAVAPAPNLRQSFMYGTDTVMNITWGPVVPASVTVRRYSGVVPPNPPYPNGTDSMFFYVQVETPGDHKYESDIKLHYIDPWQGSIPEQWMIGLGRYTEGHNWVVGFSSRVDIVKKAVTQAKVNYLDKFTGFINPYAPPVLPDRDSSNRGRRFWVSYPMNELAGSQDMVLYLSAEEPANVVVKINGTNWVRNYSVPAYSVTVSDNIPKTGPDNAFLNSPGLFDQGIYIESDVPIVAYAHYIGSASSGAAVLLPVSTWGWEYKSLSLISPGYSDAYSYLSVIADNDNTLVEITPTVPVQNPGFTVNVPTLVTLNKGQVFQLVSTTHLQELTGSVVKSLQNSNGKCFPIAVFSGNTRATLTATLCSGGSGGDFVMQQNFPATAWGKRYLTAPSSASTDATALQPNKFRIAVRDPSTIVRRNGVVMSPLINNHYYEYESNTPDYIESDKAIMVAQYLTGACTGVGDPEMIYVSPHEQGISNVTIYRNSRQSIAVNYLTLVIPAGGLPSLVIEDGTGVVAPDYVYDHPQSALFGVPYKVVVKRWSPAQPEQVRIHSDSAFMGITYGLGSVESYGYNVGFYLKNLQAAGTFANTLSTVGNTDFTCVGSPFTFNVTLPIKPTSLTYNLNSVPNLSPNAPVSIANPVPKDSVTIGRDKYYIYQITGTTYTFTQSGIYKMPVTYTSPEVEGCNNTKTDTLFIQVVPAPKTNFSINFSGCEGDIAQFTGEPIASNGSPLINYKWTFHDASVTNGPTSTFSYPAPGNYNVNLYTITADGCIGDSTKQVVVNARPTASVVTDSIAICPGGSATYNVQSPLAGATYNWYTTVTGGTALTTGGNYVIGTNGTSFQVQNVNAPAEYYVEAVSSVGCASFTRKRIKVEVLGLLAQAIPTVTSSGVGTVTFGWAPVTGATGYQVSLNGGSFINPSSGATGTTHTVTGLSTLDSVNLVVKALGSTACQNSTSGYATGCENSKAGLVVDSIATCINGTITFNIQGSSPQITYSWFNTLTGGTSSANGTSFTTPALSTTTYYYVEQASTTGCVGSPRTQVTAKVLSPLAVPVVSVTGSTLNTVSFTWGAVPGAKGYEVSVNGGPYITPGSGSTGLTHTVAGVGLLQSVCITVRANADLACQSSVSASVCGCSNSSAAIITDSVAICTGASATFNVQSPAAGITYSWFTTLTGGTALTTGGNYNINATGSTFIVSNVTTSTVFYVQQASGAGCTGSPRTRVKVEVLGPLTPAVITVAGADIATTSITFRWTAVPGAGSYQVSTDNGATWITPSSGATGLSHTVSGLHPIQNVCLKVKAIGIISCQSSESAAVCATTRPDEIFIPNTFTPNSDGKNDKLVAYGWAIQSMQFMVFNQWGEKIHEINTSAQDGTTGGFVIWDGKYKGKVQPVGVYVYAAKITLKDGTVIQKSGALNIVR